MAMDLESSLQWQPKRKSINGPRKRKRPSIEDVPAGPIPFGTQLSTAGHNARHPERTNKDGATRRKQRASNGTEDPSDSEPGSGSGRKRRRVDAQQSGSEAESPEENGSDDDDDELTRTKYAILKPRRRSVKQSIVRNKWETLNDKAQETVRALFDSVEKPLISMHREERKRIEAQTALRQLMRTLHRRLPRMPFPKDTRDWHFDLEALMANNRALEASTTSQQHAISLLKAEIRAQEAGLDDDEAELQELEHNAKREARHRQQSSSQRHPLLAARTAATPPPDTATAIHLVPSPRRGALGGDSEDASKDPPADPLPALDTALEPPLAPLLDRLRPHLDSLAGNAAQAAGLDASVARTAACLDALLSRRLAPDAHARLPAPL